MKVFYKKAITELIDNAIHDAWVYKKTIDYIELTKNEYIDLLLVMRGCFVQDKCGYPALKKFNYNGTWIQCEEEKC
jgi:hypothetical protein